MPTFKIVVAYEGTRYCGWQVQKNQVTVAQTLQDVCARIFNEKTRVIGVSRTDAGVHARGQVAMMTLARPITARRLKFAWNNALPYDMRIIDCQEVPPTYNPFDNIHHKIYHYHIMNAYALPFYMRYAWHLKRTLDYEKLNTLLQVFVGTHDFRSFSTGDERRDSTIRTIHSIAIEPLPTFHAYRIIIKGPAFLRYMIRRIVGAAVDRTVAPTGDAQELMAALAHPNARQRFFNAPAQGLTLHRIVYTHDKQEHSDDQTNFLV